MTRRTVGVLVVSGVTLAAGTPTYAKAPLVRMSVWGGGLAEAVPITDQTTLRLSNPWHGNIADWNGACAPPPSDDRPVYDIYLEARWRTRDLNTDVVRVIYCLRYVEGADGRPGVIYLPGRQEAWYKHNVRTIYRGGHEGHWHAAAPEWEASIRKALGH